MVQPIDYSLNLPSPVENFANSIALAQGVNQLKAQKANQESAAAAQKQLQLDLSQLSDNPNPAALAQIMTRHPQMSEEFNRIYGVLDAEQQKARVNQASQVYAALSAGEAGVAQNLLQEQAQAYRNSGLEKEAKALDDLIEVTRLSPETARTTAGLFLASAMGPERFTEAFTKLENDRRARQLEEADMTKAESEAFKAAVAADFAESNAAADLQKKGWDITKIQNDVTVSKENQRIAAINSELRKAESRLRGEELDLRKKELEAKLSAAQTKRDSEVRAKVAEAEGARGNIDNMLNTVDRILQLPAGTIDDAVGAWDGSWVGDVFDSLDQDVQNFKALLENLDAQSFLAQVPQMTGMGALSDAEGKKVSAALQSFNRKQSDEQFIANLKEVQRLMLKARSNLAARYGIPDSVPDTPAVETSPEDIQALLQKYGGGQ